MRFLPQFELRDPDWTVWLAVRGNCLFIDDGLDELGRPIL
jgi:hypothetical protein